MMTRACVVAAFAGVFLAGSGCGPTVGGSGEASSSTGAAEETGATSAPSTTGDPPTGTAASSSGSSSSEASSSPEASSSSSGCGGEGTAGEGSMCNYLTQDCPPGSKCVRVDDEEGYATACVAYACDGGEAGEPCTRDAETGVDDCGQSTFCATAYAPDGVGYCTDFCLPVSDFACSDPTKVCVGSSGDGQYGCIPICDPLADECLAGQACLVAYPGNRTTFGCYPALTGQMATTGDPCYGPFDGCPSESCFQCAPGFVCSNPQDYGPECELESFGCCSEYCDLDDGVCSNPAHECVPMFTRPAGDNDDVGVCGVP